MSEKTMVSGVVLFAAPAGESDKRVVLLTRERGKITAFARGARRQGSPLLAAANPFVFGYFQVYEGRTAYTLVQANVRNYFTELAAELPGVYYGFYFLEFADYYAREGNDEGEMVNLLYVALKNLMNPKLPQLLVRRVFELKTMVINGEYPQMFSCVSCGSQEGLYYFSARRGGLLCENCVRERPEARKISEAAAYTFQYIITAPVERLYTFTVTSQVLEEVDGLVEDCLRCYVDRKFRSLEILERMV